jgi:hypothetical protein
VVEVGLEAGEEGNPPRLCPLGDPEFGALVVIRDRTVVLRRGRKRLRQPIALQACQQRDQEQVLVAALDAPVVAELGLQRHAVLPKEQKGSLPRRD